MNRLLILTGIIAGLVANSAFGDWSRFRGPNGSGIAKGAVPVEFGAEKNMRWKVELPGKGVSSPIVVGDKVFVTCYSGYGGDLGDDINQLKRHLVCVDRATGKIEWDKTVPAKQPEDPWSGMGVPVHGYASHTPTSDGKNIYAFFGKSGVVAFDMKGEQLWQVSVGTESGRQRWGSSSSPIMYKDSVIVTASDEAQALVCLDAATGKERWKEEAEMLDSIWGTPALAKSHNGAEIVLAVPGEIWGFNAETGKLRWYAPGNEGASHSVVVSDGVVYSIGGGRGGANGVAVKAGQKGEVEDVVWENRASGRFASQLVYDKRVYSLSNGILTAFDATNGKKVYEERLPAATRAAASEEPGGGRRRGRGGRGAEYASPIVAGGKIYVLTNPGVVHVIETGDEFKVVGKGDLSFDRSGFNSTPAASDGQLLIRSNSHLYCIAE